MARREKNCISKHEYLLTCFILMVAGRANAQEERTEIGVFGKNPLILTASLQLKCDNDGDKIKIEDVLYKTSGCRNFESRPQDPAADDNREIVQQCMGKRICNIRRQDIMRPFLPNKPSECDKPTKYQINVQYSCVPQDKIRSMCESFKSTDSMGYLSTPSYPMLLKPGVPVAPCRCRLQATSSSSKISLTLLELNLGLRRYGWIHNSVGNSSDEDMNACQSEENMQYLDIRYNRDSANTYMLCSHKYNTQLTPSNSFKLEFVNPIDREAGAFWMQYSTNEENSMVEVSCDEPIVTTTAPKFYTKAIANSGNGNGRASVFNTGYDGHKYRIILGIVAAALFLLIIIAIIVITIKYNRRISHFMMHKYSKRDRPRKEEISDPLPTQTVGPVSRPPYTETHFDTVDEANSCGKPTAHIPPQLSVSKKLNRATADSPDPKAKLSNGKCPTFTSTYLSDQQLDSNDSDETASLGSKQYERSTQSPSSSETSITPSVRRMAPPPPIRGSAYQTPSTARPSVRGSTYETVSTPRPKLEDIWVRDNGAENTSSRRVLLNNQSETDRLLTNRAPTVSFNTAIGRWPTEEAAVPLMQRSEDSKLRYKRSCRANSEDEEMDIKFIHSKAPVVAVKPALKYSASHQPTSQPTTPKESVKFSDTVHHSYHNPQYRESEAESQRRQRMKAAILQHPSLNGGSKTPPAIPKTPKKNSNVARENPLYDGLTVDLGGSMQPRKSKSLPGGARRINSSTPSLKTYAQSAKRAKRKCGSDNDNNGSSSSQEQLSPIVSSGRTRSTRSLTSPATSRQRTTNGTMISGASRRARLGGNDEELFVRIDGPVERGSSR